MLTFSWCQFYLSCWYECWLTIFPTLFLRLVLGLVLFLRGMSLLTGRSSFLLIFATATHSSNRASALSFLPPVFFLLNPSSLICSIFYSKLLFIFFFFWTPCSFFLAALLLGDFYPKFMLYYSESSFLCLYLFFWCLLCIGGIFYLFLTRFYIDLSPEIATSSSMIFVG